MRRPIRESMSLTCAEQQPPAYEEVGAPAITQAWRLKQALQRQVLLMQFHHLDLSGIVIGPQHGVGFVEITCSVGKAVREA